MFHDMCGSDMAVDSYRLQWFYAFVIVALAWLPPGLSGARAAGKGGSGTQLRGSSQVCRNTGVLRWVL